jgi:hypothetical protein
MTTIVGIFDDSSDVDKVVERLAAAGFDGTVYDEAIVTEEPGRSIRRVRPLQEALLRRWFWAVTHPI